MNMVRVIPMGNAGSVKLLVRKIKRLFFSAIY